MKAVNKILFFLMLSCASALAQDTLKNPTDYPLNDPRNPNCPCHKLQAQADEEWKQMQNKEKNSVQQQKTNDIQQQRRRANPAQQAAINTANTPAVNDSLVQNNINIAQINIMNDDNQIANAAVVNKKKNRNGWIQSDDNGNGNSEPEENVKQKEVRREVGTSGGNGSYRKMNNTKKALYRFNKKLDRAFSHKKTKHKSALCGCWTT